MERQAEPRKEPRAGPIVLAAVRIPRLLLMSPLGVLNICNMLLKLPNIAYKKRKDPYDSYCRQNSSCDPLGVPNTTTIYQTHVLI